MQRIAPFFRLARFDDPLPILFLYVPCVWGLCLVWRIDSLRDATQRGVDLSNLGMATVLKPDHWAPFCLWLGLFAVGAIVMRAAGCVFNDMCDRTIDAQVSRTRMRPLAAQQITLTQARVFFIALLILGLSVWLCLNTTAQSISLVGLGLLILYPFCKRFFMAPQLILGCAFNIGIIVAVAQMNPDYLMLKETWILYGAGICWTLYYDTIYALQDRADDERIGVHSTARLFKGHIKKALAVFYSASLLLVAALGPVLHGGFWFYVSILSYGLWDLGYELRRWDLSDPVILRKGFHHAIYLGFAIVTILI